MINDTFVGSSFLFGFKQCDNAGNLPSADTVLPNEHGISFPRGLLSSDKVLSDTIAWQMLFACSDNSFMTVLARLRQIVDDFGSSRCVDSVVNESLVFAVSGCEGVQSLSETPSVERKCIGSVKSVEESFFLSCDQDEGCDSERKESMEGTSGRSSLRLLPVDSGVEDSFTCTIDNELILTNLPRARFNAQLLAKQDDLICDILKGNKYDSGFCSEAVTAERDERAPGNLNEANTRKSDVHLNSEPRRLKQEPDRKSPGIMFDESSADEIEICRAASVASQERCVFASDFSSKRCVALAVFQEMKRISQKSSYSQLCESARAQSSMLDLVEAPHSEDLEAFLKDYELNKELTCESFEVPASNSRHVVCHSESISRDSLSENGKDCYWEEQPYSEDLEEFLQGQRSDERRLSDICLKTLKNSSMLQQTPVQGGFAPGTVPSKSILEHPCTCVSSLNRSGGSDEMFSFWSDDFEQQVAHSSIAKNLEKSARCCSSQRPPAEVSNKHSSTSELVEKPAKFCSSHESLTESLEKHSSILPRNSSSGMRRSRSRNIRRNSVQPSPFRSPVNQSSTSATGEIHSITTLNETKENMEPKADLCYASDTFDSSSSSSSISLVQSRNTQQQTKKLTRKTTLSIATTPTVIYVKKTPRTNCFFNYKTPANTTSSSDRLITHACNSFSRKTLHRKVLENCMANKDVIVFNHSTKKSLNGTVATPGNSSFDLFQSPCFIRTGLSRRQSRLLPDLPSGTKFQFSSTPLSTDRVCELSQKSPVVVEDRVADNNDIGANTCMHVAEPFSPDCIACTFRVSTLPRQLNSLRAKASSIVCETAAYASASLISSISPELFRNSLQRPSYEEPSPGQTFSSWTGANRHEIIPAACNLFNSSQYVNRSSTRDNTPGLSFNQSEDLFGDSGDLFLD